MKTTKKYGKKADLALSLWVKLARAADTMAILTGRDITRYGITIPQFGVIEALGHLGPMTVGTICAKKLSTGGNMTVIIDNLEKEGIVERVEYPEDRRAFLIRLTRKGKKLFKKIFISHAKYVKNLVWSALNENEIFQLSLLLKKLGLSLKQKL